MRARRDEFIYEVLTRLSQGAVGDTEDITDRAFLMVQSDARLQQWYNELSADEKARHALNSRLGRRIREHFSLQNTGRCHNPKSRLIKSYERHDRRGSPRRTPARAGM